MLSKVAEDRLYRRVYEVMHYLWDPIGVSDAPGAWDEYNSYLPQVFKLVKQRDRAAIVDYLEHVTVQLIGLRSNRPHSERISDILLNWQTAIATEDADGGTNP